MRDEVVRGNDGRESMEREEKVGGGVSDGWGM